jgi:hypothetical protein
MKDISKKKLKKLKKGKNYKKTKKKKGEKQKNYFIIYRFKNECIYRPGHK